MDRWSYSVKTSWQQKKADCIITQPASNVMNQSTKCRLNIRSQSEQSGGYRQMKNLRGSRSYHAQEPTG